MSKQGYFQGPKSQFLAYTNHTASLLSPVQKWNSQRTVYKR